MVIAVPAGAHGTPAGGSSKPYGISHKCMPHKVAYNASGSLVDWSLTKNSDGTYSGTVTVHVTRSNHHAKDTKGSDTTFTVTNARVRFGQGVSDPPATGSRVKVIGKVTAVAKKCSNRGDAGTVTVRRIVVHVAKTSS
jgi:hypothetical protein